MSRAALRWALEAIGWRWRGGVGRRRAGWWLDSGKARTYELVLDRIEEQIQSGRLRAGDRLPPERDLAAALAVSRVAVREAMRVLQAIGVITHGTWSGRDAGTVLTAAPGEALTRLIRFHVLLASVGSDDVVRARIALERESARLASQDATAADHEVMLAAMEAPGVSLEASTTPTAPSTSPSPVPAAIRWWPN